MDKAKAAIKDFTSRAGHHDTTVHESVAPAVQHETIKQHQHENVQTAVDKEVHQDHYHQTVQPVHDREVLPEKHSHNLANVEHREFDNRDHEGTKARLAEQQQAFRDERVVADATHSEAVKPTVGGEHVHHHIHETIQPVVHKETIQPSVVHTTVPIHETHHQTAKHHETSQLPAVSLGEFKERGGVLGGREERYDAFEGAPKNIGGLGQTEHGSHHGRDAALGAGAVGAEHHHHNQHGNDHHVGRDAALGAGAVGAAGAAEHHHHNKQGNEHHTGRDAALGAGAVGAAGAAEHHHKNKDNIGRNDGYGNTGYDSNNGGAIGNTERGYNDTVATPANTKPSLMDKLNPKVDANGDGKAGFMK